MTCIFMLAEHSLQFVARYGALTQNLVVATCYATLGTDAVVHAVNEGPGISCKVASCDASDAS